MFDTILFEYYTFCLKSERKMVNEQLVSIVSKVLWKCLYITYQFIQ